MIDFDDAGYRDSAHSAQPHRPISLDVAAGENESSACDSASTDAIISAADALLRRFAASNRTGSSDEPVVPAPVVLPGADTRIAYPTEGTLLWGRFHLVRVLGRGGFGIVFQAFDTILQRNVALKLPRPEFLCSDDHRGRFLREARVAADLDHPGIVKIYEVGERGSIWYIVSAFCPGPTLSGWLRERDQTISCRTAAEVVRQIAEAVDHAHRHAVLHLDLKPANVLMAAAESGGNVRALLTDFGLASREGEHVHAAGQWGGTCRYMPPEAFSDEGRAPAVSRDVYALGVILHEVLTAGLSSGPKTSEPLGIAKFQPTESSIRSLRHDLPRDLEAICARCVEHDPSRRYQTARELAQDLQCFLSGRPVSARPCGPARRTWCWARRKPWTASLLGATLFMFAAGGTATFHQWVRAEYNGALAQSHLREAEDAIVWLGWAIDDASFWAEPHDAVGEARRRELGHYYTRALARREPGRAVRPIDAASHCFFAQMAVSDQDFGEAQAQFQRSIREWHEVLRRQPANCLYRRALARTLYCYGRFRLAQQGEQDGMRRIVDGKLYGELAWEVPLDRPLLSDYAVLLLEKGGARVDRSVPANPARDFEACIEVSTRLDAVEPRPEHRFRAAQARIRLAWTLRAEGRKAEASAASDLAATELRRLVALMPNDHSYRLELASLLHNTNKNSGSAVAAIDEAICLMHPVVTAPGSRRGHLLYARLLAVRARMSPDEPLAGAPDPIRESALAVVRSLRCGECSPCLAAEHLQRLAVRSLALARKSDALSFFGQAADLYSQSQQLKTQDTTRMQQVGCLAKAAALCGELGEPLEAIAKYTAAVRLLEESPDLTKAKNLHMRVELRRLRAERGKLQEQVSASPVAAWR